MRRALLCMGYKAAGVLSMALLAFTSPQSSCQGLAPAARCALLDPAHLDLLPRVHPCYRHRACIELQSYPRVCQRYALASVFIIVYTVCCATVACRLCWRAGILFRSKSDVDSFSDCGSLHVAVMYKHHNTQASRRDQDQGVSCENVHCWCAAQ